MNAFAHFETDGASRYLATLCAHFGRKVEATFEADKGWVQFPFGRCELVAGDVRLDLMASANDQADLDLIIQVVTNHLERFAFRENPMLDWTVDRQEFPQKEPST